MNMKNISQIASHLVTPLMIIMLTWISQFYDEIELTELLIITSITLLLLFYHLYQQDKNRYNKTSLKKLSAQTLKYFTLITLTAIVIQIAASWTITGINKSWGNTTISYLFIGFTLLLLFIHLALNHFKSNKNVNLLFVIFFSLSTTIYLSAHYQSNSFDTIKIIFFVLLSFYLVYLFHVIARHFVKVNNTYTETSGFEQKQHLIVFLSVLKNKDICKIEYLDNFKIDSKSLLKIAERIEEDFKKDYHQWEMTLRAIDYHINTEGTRTGALKQLTILASSNPNNDNDSSMPQAKYFIDFLRKYIDKYSIDLKIKLLVKNINNNTLELYSGLDIDKDSGVFQKYAGINFNDFEDCRDALVEILQKEESNINHPNTVIDFTGGQKITSAAATLAATVYDVYNQYVDTNGDKEITGYNFLYVDPKRLD